MTRWSRRFRSLAVALALGLCAPALAQVTTPVHSDIRSFLAGVLILADGAPTPEPGDQIVAFFGNRVIGVFTFTSASVADLEFRFLISGDDPGTSQDEGPERGDRITFGFYDASTDEIRRDIRGWNSATNEFRAVRFEGDEVIDIPGLPLDLTPTQPIDLILGVEEDDDGSGGGGLGGGDPDVNGDGRIDREDAAIVLRVVAGGGRGMSPNLIAAADVNADGAVTTDDAIAVLRAR